MQSLNRAILEARSTDEIAQVAMRHIGDLIPCLRASVAVFDFNKDCATIIAIQTRHETKLGVGAELPLESFADIDLLSKGTTVRIDDVQTAVPSRTNRILQAEGILSFISVPLMSHRKRCIEAGADDFLSKPFKMVKLLESLQRLLRRELVLEDNPPVIESRGRVQNAPHGTNNDQITLPSEYRTALIELARRGDVKGLREQATKLKQFDARYTVFAEILKTLAQRFQVKKIRALMESTEEGS